uniref:Putative secreted peptide n=1 Tax=Anopheles braziliensis TaxID=58242 RepID=A0A2M3ZS26_9DIPT
MFKHIDLFPSATQILLQIVLLLLEQLHCRDVMLTRHLKRFDASAEISGGHGGQLVLFATSNRANGCRLPFSGRFLQSLREHRHLFRQPYHLRMHVGRFAERIDLLLQLLDLQLALDHALVRLI